jgi:hypothetical protein
MRAIRLMLLLVLATALACRSGKTVPEDGAVLLHVKTIPGAPAADELLAWVYDDTGRLWDGVRMPAEGSLAASGGEDLGTILIQPGVVQGRLRVHLRAFVAGTRVMDGVLVIESLASGSRTFDIILDPALLADADADDVPDAIDDCPTAANPAQGGCPSPGEADAGPDAESDVPADQPVDSDPRAPEAPTEDGGDAPATDLDLPRHDGADPSAADSAAVPGLDGGVAVADTAEVRGRDGADLPPADTADAISGDGSGAEVDVAQAMDVPGRDADAPAADVPDTGEPVDGGGAPPCDGDDCKKPQGAACATNGDCSSGWCADGVCCTNACLGPCRSCNQPASNGVCQGYPAGSDPETECPTSSCNGVGACGPATSNLANGSLCSSGDQCTSGFCADGVCCDSACDQPCQACGTGACLSVKKTDDVPECTGSLTCNPTGKCVAK